MRILCQWKITILEVFGGSNTFTNLNINLSEIKEYKEEKFINNNVVLTVKEGYSKIGIRASLPLSYNLKKGKKYKISTRFKIKTMSPIINFHIYNEEINIKQVILKCNVLNHEEYQNFDAVFIPNSNEYNRFMIGAVHIKGDDNYFAIDYIYIFMMIMKQKN